MGESGISETRAVSQSLPLDVEKLLAPNPRKQKLKLIFLAAGLALVVAGIVMLALGVDLSVKMSGFNLSPIIYFLVLFIGLIIASKYFTLAPYSLRENSLTALRLSKYREKLESSFSFFSYSYSRILAAALFLVVGALDYVYLTPFIGNPGESVFGGEYGGVGTAIVLGGVSFFYPVGMPLLIAGIGLALYLLLSWFMGRFAQSQNLLYFHEFRLLAPWLTEVPKASVEAVRYQNSQLGPKVMWAVVFVPFALVVLQYGLPLYAQPRATSDILPIMMTVSAGAALLATLLLVFWPQDYFELATKEMLYEMWIAPAVNPGETRDNLAHLLGFQVPQLGRRPRPKNKRTFAETQAAPQAPPAPAQTNLPGVSPTQKEFGQILLGALLVGLGLVGAFAQAFFGLLFWAGAAVYGLVLLARGFASDFSNRDGTQVQWDAASGSFQYHRRFARKFQCVRFPRAKQVNVENCPRKLDVIDVVAIPWLVALGTFQVVLGWIVGSPFMLPGMGDMTVTTILLAVVVFLVVAWFGIPAPHVVAAGETVRYAIPVSTAASGWGTFRGMKARFASARIDAKVKKALVLRFGALLVTGIVAGVLAAIILYI